jgi:hypothetical protein
MPERLSQMNNTGFISPIPIQYVPLNQQYQYNPTTNTIPIIVYDPVLFFPGLMTAAKLNSVFKCIEINKHVKCKLPIGLLVHLVAWL